MGTDHTDLIEERWSHDVAVLRAIYEWEVSLPGGGNLRIAELAARMGRSDDQGAVTRAVDYLRQDGCIRVAVDPVPRELDHMILGMTPLGLRRCRLWPNDDDAFLEAVLRLVEKQDPTTGAKLRKAAATLGMGTLQALINGAITIASSGVHP